MMNDTAQTLRRPWLWLTALILFSIALRFVGLNWDQGHSFHPDERAITYAIQRVSFSPLRLNPEWFNYGSLPLYVTRAVTSLAGLYNPTLRNNYDFTILAGRALSGVAGVLTVILLVFLGARLYNIRVGLLAGFLLAACVLHLQHSHFMTTDVFLTLMILLALYFCVGIAQRGRTRDYLCAGIAIGFALATKVSAAPIFLPLGVAGLVRVYRERRLLPVLARGLLAVGAAAGAFFVGEPYAVLDFNTFWRNVTEQGNMVRHAGRFPYTNQYIGTAKYGYEIEQLFWCMGPFLAVATLIASARQAMRIVRERSGEALVLLSWVVPYFLITGWFEVKFIRYLLPIYPIMILWAAAWMWDRAQAGRFGRVVLWTVSGGTLLAALAFLSIYQRPHTVVEASEWVYRHVERGSTIVTQHWDEGFPMPLPGRPHGQYHVVPLPYYEPDRPAKIRGISTELAKADYLAFQTKRLYGAITQAPKKYPLTNNYFYLLFAGDLGYELVHEQASRPSLLGFEFPDELADESFSVYDHPKVLVFQNRDHLTSDEIFQRVLSGVPSRKLTRSDLLLAGTGARGFLAGSKAPPIRSSALALLWFVIVIEALGLIAHALLRRRLPIPGGYGLAKIVGILLFAYIPWLLVGLGQVNLSRPTLIVTFVALGACGLAARGRRPAESRRTEWWVTEFLFWGTFAFFLLVRAWNPEVFWGEKPMDFSFLNALTRTTTLPPPEPWFAGSHLQYTYFGHYIVAALGKLCNVHPGITFNVGIALFAALTAIAAFALGSAIGGRWRVGVLAAIFVTLIGNLSGPAELWARRQINFDYFWATSRVIKHTINEYPFWSFLFADLHAHVLVMPFSLAFLALTVWWVKRKADVHRPLLFLLLGLVLGAVIVTNGWSTPTYVLFFPLLLLSFSRAEPRVHLGRWILVIIGRVLLPSVAVVGTAYALYFPFWHSYTPPELGWGWEGDAFVNARDYAGIFGLFLFVAVSFVFAAWRRELLPRDAKRLGAARSWPLWVTAFAALGCFVPTIPAVAALLAPAATLLKPALGFTAFGSVRAGLVILGAIPLHLALRRSIRPSHRIIAVMLAFAFFVTAGCDVVHISDRMNTIFKFYLDAWFLFAVTSAAAVYEIHRGLIRSPRLRMGWKAVLSALIGVAVFTAATCTYAVLHTNRVRSPKPTLDGTAYLALRDPHEAAAIEWLDSNISGIPVIAEAWGPSYQSFSRISMNTGLPTIVGWEHHVFQRSHSRGSIHRRENDVKLLYTAADRTTVDYVLQKYHVALVYVGPLERRTYPGGSLARFKEWTDLLTPVYQNAGATIFAVNGQFTAMPTTTIEEVPQEEGGEIVLPGAGGELRQPRDLAADAQGNIYVADFDNNRVQVFTSKLAFIRGWGRKGGLPGQFKQPCGIDVDSAGNVYVADTWNQRVQVFDSQGKYLREWGGPWYGPRGIAVHADRQIFLVDTGNHRIRRFDMQGNEELSWGGQGSAPGKFKEPVGVATDAAGRVYVTDNGNARLQIFESDGTLVRTFPVTGWKSEVFSEPKVVVTPDQTIWVTVPLRKVLRAYDQEGRMTREINGRAIPGSYFKTPLGIAYRPSTNELLITDLENRIVRIPLQATN